MMLLKVSRGYLGAFFVGATDGGDALDWRLV